MGKFQIKQMADGQYYFHLKAVNGEIILRSEGYTSQQGCMNGIDSVKRNSLNDRNYVKNKSLNREHYFYLKAQNGEIIALSEMYSSKKNMENGIKSVKENAPSAPIN